MTPDHVRKPGSEGLPWSDPDSDPLADLLDSWQHPVEPAPERP